jgi:hypothetical protein
MLVSLDVLRDTDTTTGISLQDGSIMSIGIGIKQTFSECAEPV